MHEQPKRRRASAQPNLGGVSRRKAPSQPVLVEESEPEEDDEVVIRKVGRSKKSVSHSVIHDILSFSI